MTVLVELEPPYSHVLSEEQRAVIATHALVPPVFDADTEEGKEVMRWGRTITVSSDVLSTFHGWTVAKVIDNASTRALVEFGQRNTTVVNQRCNVAVAGLGLLTIDDVEVREDFCTDELQAKLNEGWRIIAVCVQPDQRRPDYVLGRNSR